MMGTLPRRSLTPLTHMTHNTQQTHNTPPRAPRVRVQGIEKEDMGVLPLDEARAIAREDGVDLVMISPDADPPVCRMIDFSKYKYELERATKSRQKASKG